MYSFIQHSEKNGRCGLSCIELSIIHAFCITRTLLSLAELDTFLIGVFVQAFTVNDNTLAADLLICVSCYYEAVCNIHTLYATLL